MFLKKINLYLIGSFNFLVFLILAILQLRFFGTTNIKLVLNFEIYLLFSALFLIALSLIYYYYLDIRKIIILGSIGNTIIFIITIINNHVIYEYPEFPEVVPFFFSGLLTLVSSLVIYSILLISLIRLKQSEFLLVKKTILDLGTHFAQLEIREIAEECKIDKNTIIKIVMDMIDKKEIFADYFNSTKTVIFDKRANIDNIDGILSSYEVLGEKKTDKLKI